WLATPRRVESQVDESEPQGPALGPDFCASVCLVEGGGAMSDPFDPSDPAQLRRWLVNMRVALDDAHTVVVDMMRLPRRRRLGPCQPRWLYREAHDSMLSLLNYALGVEPPRGGTPPDEGGPPLQ